MSADRFAALRVRLPAQLAQLPRIAERQAMTEPPFHRGDALLGGARILGEALALLPEQSSDAGFACLEPLLPAACADLDVAAPGRVMTATGLISLRIIAANAGRWSAVWPTSADTWLPALRHRQPPAEAHLLRKAAWQACALGDRSLAAELLAAAHQDGCTNTASALGAALIRDEPTAELWTALIADLPRLITERACDFADVHAFARALHHQRGADPAHSAAFLREALRG